MPDWLGQLTNLQSLDLSGLKLSSLPDSLGQLTNLQSLDLRSTNLSSLPDWLGQLTNLQSLNLRSTNLSSLPDWLGQLTNLQSLDLSYNNLSRLPDWLGQLTNLQSLYLSFTKLSRLPDWLGQLTNLQSLYLSDNNLSRLPDWLGQLTNLQSLDLSRLNLSRLPDSLGQLTNLQSLDLRSTNLSSLPDWLGQLTNLQSLDLSANNLSSLPETIVTLPHLRLLYVAKNPITEPPPEQLGKALRHTFETVNLEAVRRYYAQLQRAGQTFFYEAKLLLIGEGGAGKTSLARKLLDETASLPPPDDSTEGIDIHTWEFPVPNASSLPKQSDPVSNLQSLISTPPTYQANIWDFGGQSVYHATHQFFLSKRSVYVLLADTRRQHTDFYDWLRMQETFGQDSPILLLKNKNRQHGNQFVIENLPQLQERFPNLAKIIEVDLNNIPHEEAWPDLLHYLQKQLMSLDHIGVPRPKTWVAVRQALRDDKRDSISRRQFLELCQDHQISDELDALQLSDYLHHVGDILHFEDDPVLADLVILKPTWALDAVYRVLDNAEVSANWGQFSRQQLRHLWHEAKYENHREQLLRLMQKFKLCYQLQHVPDNFIAPQLLAPETPPYTWQGDAEDLQLRYRYPIFMPRGLLSRAIVSLHHRIETQELVWRAGVILRDDYARAELLELRGEGEIRLRVTGSNKRDLLMEIARALDELHRGFSNKLKYEKLVPCRCDTCRAATTPHFFALAKLLERLSYRKETIECNNPPLRRGASPQSA